MKITIFRRDNPASSCNRIINDNPSARSGYYWVLAKSGVVQQVVTVINELLQVETLM